MYKKGTSDLKFRDKYPLMDRMMNIRFHKRIAKVCALVAATLIVPSLAFADDNSQGNEDQGNTHKVPVVPEANAGWVLVPFFGAVLLFSWRQFSRAKAESR